MKIILTVSILFIVLLPSSIFSQAKVGTWGGHELLISPSIRSNGMGLLGTALVDEHSSFYNPGSTGLYYLNNEISFTPYSGSQNLGYDWTFWQSSIAAPIIKIKSNDIHNFGISSVISYTRSDLKIQELDYNRVPTGRVYGYNSQILTTSIGIGYSGIFQFGVGLNVKYYDINDFFQDLALDAGAIVRLPIKDQISDKIRIDFIPSFGFSLSNWGPIFESGNQERTFILANRIGIASIFGLNKLTVNGDWRLIRIIPSFEAENLEDERNITKKGIELEFGEAFTYRLGKYIISRIENSTWGYTVNSAGIFKFISSLTNHNPEKKSGILSFLTNRLSFQYSEANFDKDSIFKREPFKGFSIRYKLSD